MKKEEAAKIIGILKKKHGKNPAVEITLGNGAATIGYFKKFVVDKKFVKLIDGNGKRGDTLVSLERVKSLREPTVESAIKIIKSYEEFLFNMLENVNVAGREKYAFDSFHIHKDSQRR